MFRQLSSHCCRSIVTRWPTAVKEVERSCSYNRSIVQLAKPSSFSTLAANGVKGRITIETITEKDIPELVPFLKKHFYKVEPICVYLNLDEDCKEMEEFSFASISDNCSFKAVNEEGTIVGAITNEIYKRPASGTPPPIRYADTCKHEKFKILMQLVDHLYSQFNVFDLYPNVHQYLDCKISAVNRDYGGLGISAMLAERTKQWMRENDTHLIISLCSSYYSARIGMKRSSFKKLFSLNYTDYVVNGERPIILPPPHTAAQVIIYELDEK